jgi:hypothetical protein
MYHTRMTYFFIWPNEHESVHHATLLVKVLFVWWVNTTLIKPFAQTFSSSLNLDSLSFG